MLMRATPDERQRRRVFELGMRGTFSSGGHVRLDSHSQTSIKLLEDVASLMSLGRICFHLHASTVDGDDYSTDFSTVEISAKYLETGNYAQAQCIACTHYHGSNSIASGSRDTWG